MSGAFVLASVEGATLKEHIDQYYEDKPVFTVGTIDEAKDRSNASEGEKHKAVLGVDLDAEVTRLEERLRDVKRRREEARTMKANTKPVEVRLKQSAESSKIIKQVLDQMMDSVVMLTHYELFVIAPELECQYAAKLMRTTQMCDKMLNKAGSGPAKAEEEETSEEARTDSREDQHTGTSVACKDNKAQSSPAAEPRTSRLLCRRTSEAVGSEQCRARECWIGTPVSNNKAGSVPVRLATVKLNDKLETESLLDQGAVMNVMCKDVWKRLGVPKERVQTNLRPANAGSIAIKGVILRLKVSVGGISMVMPVHVVKDTTFDMIIRRPFFALTECETKDFKDSNQILTLTDPADQNQKCQVETQAAVG
ncbi:uncharacterized protein FOMMEDRAFT_163275 [Fomitiporia mediterranea MF3/22]|uniref:Aspartic peptidase DDI1-type domain-containing protein n=1 Tax=Fomitiporia mediterranea (strain MF3/22) TaxID=694068 RepID=R7SFH0_FOMME|nr:uncharacterized protein FOMMEDRAFT_163275 [Fomitiporia mediterranea MF3/22]EJC97453.1 hypothetical protein FOMMEDRAFT_163275 [Fomitiporia mediterranea MF3/22]